MQGVGALTGSGFAGLATILLATGVTSLSLFTRGRRHRHHHGQDARP
ncbi:MAG TPA: hypothetical protein VFC99_18855 [Acidimicrobiia bacterium]|nr:hypothetical protein [Acidimicrobiia bacterium]